MFLLGACFALHTCIFTIAFINRTKNAPYREAFAWLALILALQCIWELIGYLFPDMNVPNLNQLNICVDATAVPFFVLQMECICKQNIEEESWKMRWIQLGISEIPILTFLLISLFTGWEYLLRVMDIWFFIYIASFAVRAIRYLREYNQLLSYANDVKNRSINWAAWVFGTSILIMLSYTFLVSHFNNLMIENLYYLVNMSLMCVNAYFIWTQRPENSKEMAKIKAILHDERERVKEKMVEMEEQMVRLSEKTSHIDKLTNEMSENAEKLKRKANIKEYMDTMRLLHPQLEQTLNSIADTRLTNHDILLCMLILDGRKVSYIAKMTGVNVKSVEMGRSRLRKKLKLTAEEKLNDFIQRLANKT